MFIPALFTVAKIWKQPTCPSTDEWVKKMWSVCVFAIQHMPSESIHVVTKNVT